MAELGKNRTGLTGGVGRFQELASPRKGEGKGGDHSDTPSAEKAGVKADGKGKEKGKKGDAGKKGQGCWECGGSGHIAEDCPNKRSSSVVRAQEHERHLPSLWQIGPREEGLPRETGSCVVRGCWSGD